MRAERALDARFLISTVGVKLRATLLIMELPRC